MKFKIDHNEMTGTIDGIPVKFVENGSCKKCPARGFDVCYGIGSKCFYDERKDKNAGYWKTMNFFERFLYGLKQGIEP